MLKALLRLGNYITGLKFVGNLHHCFTFNMRLTLTSFLLHGSLAWIPLINSAIIERQAPPISLVTEAEWNELKAEVGGRLYDYFILCSAQFLNV